MSVVPSAKMIHNEMGNNEIKVFKYFKRNVDDNNLKKEASKNYEGHREVKIGMSKTEQQRKKREIKNDI